MHLRTKKNVKSRDKTCCDMFAILGKRKERIIPSSILEVLPHITIYADAISLAIPAFTNVQECTLPKRAAYMKCV